MTTIPPESQDQRKPVDSILESPQSPDELAHALSERVVSDVASFESDTFSRVGAIAQMEGSLSPDVARATRTAVGLHELPGILEEARALGDRTTVKINEASARPVASNRTMRALRGELPQVEISHTPTADEAPASREVAEVPEEERVEQREAQRIPMEVFRLQRELNLASAVEKLERGEKLDQSHVEMLSGALEGRGWQRLCAEVHEGDGLAAFLVPNAEYFSIKKFNDELFGMQQTDNIIKRRREVLWQELSSLGLTRVATSYKDEFYRIPDKAFESDRREGLMQDLSDAAERMRVAMTSHLVELSATEWSKAEGGRKEKLDEFIRQMLGEEGYAKYIAQRELFLSAERTWRRAIEDEVKAEQEKAAATSDDALEVADTNAVHASAFTEAAYTLYRQAQHGLRSEVVSPTLKAHRELGYRVTFGVSEVKEAGQNDYVHIERSVSASLKGAMTARYRTEQGMVFSNEDADQAISRVIELRDRIGVQDLMDADGRVYPILEVRPDGMGKLVHVLNLDLIREIRKGTFVSSSDSAQSSLYQTVREYMEAINIFDVTKPLIHEELAGGVINGAEQTVAQSVEQTKTLSKRLHAGGLAEHERLEIANLLKQDAKDRACSSVMEFHRKALEIANCSYVSLDALDIGPELLQEFELLAQRVKNGRLTFDQAQLIAGDATTKKMRAFRAQVIEAYKELCGGEEPIMSVGGDEVTLAMDSARITDAFLLRLRNIKLSDREGGSVRVVKTAIGTGERHSVLKGETRMKEHLEAIKRAEEGTSIAKRIEKTVRVIRSSINDLPKDERDAHRTSLAALNLETFAVHEREGADGHFELILNADTEAEPIRANLEGKLEELDGLASRLSQAVLDRRAVFFESQRSQHPKLTAEMVPIALRRKDQSERGFESFMRTLT